MTLIQQSIRYPVTTAVGVIVLVLFGAIALFRIPVQLTPDVEDPIVTVTTVWPGASPVEIEREIVQEQEDQLKSLEGMTEMESQSMDSVGRITLYFRVGTDMDRAVLLVSNRLEQVQDYPDDADKPVIRLTDPESNAMAWFVLYPAEQDGFEGDVSTLYDFVDDFVTPELERVPGVAASTIFGGREREMHVIVDPAELAARQVTLNEVAAALDRENRNFSGGDFDEGKRRYVVRTVGEYSSTSDIENIVIAVRGGIPVYLRDVGRAELGFRKPRMRAYNRGQEILAVSVSRETGANVLWVMEGVDEAIGQINRERLRPRGLQLVKFWDETDYIRSAIGLVQQALVVGGLFAVLALLVYLRSGTSTLVIAVAIPISVIGAFLAMLVFGRTLNVISLAGMAFAVGMVVDNSIVVLENIYRHRQMGKSGVEAAFQGAREVWGAVLASTLTTVAVFVPVIFMKEEVGQLFGDIALAISFAVAVSLVVSVTVIPSLSAKILQARGPSEPQEGYRALWGLADRARALNEGVSDLVYRMTGSTAWRLAVVVVFTLAALGGSWLLKPKSEYLPQGNPNFTFGYLLPPPGYSLDEIAGLEKVFSGPLGHLWETPAGSPEARALPGGGVSDYFYIATTSMAFMGASAREPLRVGELIPEFQRASREIPGSIFVMTQWNLFQRREGEGRNIDVEITGPDLERLIGLGAQVFGAVMQKMPAAQARPIPSLDLGNPEVRIVTHRRRAAELGLSNRELGYAISALIDGAKASEFQYEGKEIDLRLMAEGRLNQRTHLLEQLPIATPRGGLVTVGSVADLEVVNGPVQVNHVERERSIVIQVTPDETTSLEEAMETVRGEILAPLEQSGQLGGLYKARLTGVADKLEQTLDAVFWNLVLALVITYLVMAALFESFLYPLVIMFSVPMAALGGFLGLKTVHVVSGNLQAMDVLTMLGFVILIGTVVNNAILIVHQSLNHMRRESMASREAIRESVRNRMRPIFMSVTTSVCGMLPLVLFPGAGSELYRELGSVVVGGLLLSGLFTLLLVPALFSLSLDVRQALGARLAALLGSRGSRASGVDPRG